MKQGKYKGILFLDMDGVLCTPRMWCARPRSHNALDPVCVQMLENVVLKYELTLVCSSAWRHKKDVPDILATHGFRGHFARRVLYGETGNYIGESEPLVCNTKRLCGIGIGRGTEIKLWLSENSDLMEDPSKFIIFDDEVRDIIEHPELRRKVVKCDTYNGITFEAYQKADKLLERMFKPTNCT